MLKAVEKVAEECMVAAAAEAKAENEEQDQSRICAAFDGSWQKRGHLSLNGVFTVTSVGSSKILDVECLSKYCSNCKLIAKDCKRLPKCTSNFDGSSGAMEVAGAHAVFNRSVEKRGVRYVRYLGDGDSKAFKSMLDAKPYGDIEIIKL